MRPEERRARAYAAHALMNDPTLHGGWDELANALRAQWEASWWPAKRNRIWSQLRHLKLLRQKLASFAGQSRD